MALERIVFIQTSLGHYHYPRMQALAERCRKAGILLFNIELASNEEAYQWIVEAKREEFNNITLFVGQVLEDISRNRMWSALKGKLEELGPDVIFILGYSLGVMRRAKLWAEARGIATVLISDSNEFDRKRSWLFELIKSLFVSRFDAAFVGGTGSSLYIEKLGIPEERIVQGCDVIDVKMFSDQASRNRKRISQIHKKRDLPERYFLCVGRFIKSKNLLGLINAYKKYVMCVQNELAPWKLVICGSGPEEEELQRHIANLPSHLKERILLYGYVKQPDIIDFFCCASCLILPSISESWGLVVSEAMACSVPVIVSRKAGCSLDLVKNNMNGWLFDPHDTDELANLMADFSKLDDAARIEMGLRGHRLISEWGLEKFTRGALESAQIAIGHRNHRK